jgi:hypothetical protein
VSSTVFSTRFIGGVSSPTSSQTYSVPAGNVAVLKSINAIAAGSGVTVCNINVNNVWTVFVQASLAVNVLYQWSGHQVLNPGDQLECGSAGGNTYFTVSGYLLTLP